jgi:hypothetical protein
VALTSPHLDGLLNFGRSIEPTPPPSAIPEAVWCGAMSHDDRVDHVFVFADGDERFVCISNGRNSVSFPIEAARRSSLAWICHAAQIVDAFGPTPTGAE